MSLSKTCTTLVWVSFLYGLNISFADSIIYWKWAFLAISKMSDVGFRGVPLHATIGPKVLFLAVDDHHGGIVHYGLPVVRRDRFVAREIFAVGWKRASAHQRVCQVLFFLCAEVFSHLSPTLGVVHPFLKRLGRTAWLSNTELLQAEVNRLFVSTKIFAPQFDGSIGMLMFMRKPYN